MERDKLKISDVAQRTGINRSTISALCRQSTVRVELPAVEQLCRLFRCPIGDLFEVVVDDDRAPS
jgi:putative transcriptional regulator